MNMPVIGPTSHFPKLSLSHSSALKELQSSTAETWDAIRCLNFTVCQAGCHKNTTRITNVK